MSVLSGQHIGVEPRQQRHSGRIMAKYLCLGDSLVGRKGIETTANIIISNLLAVKISNRENSRILAQTGSMSVLSGQHIGGEPRQQCHSGRIIVKYLCLGDSLVGRAGIEPAANGLKVYHTMHYNHKIPEFTLLLFGSFVPSMVKRACFFIFSPI
jgi:hypothetical protein